VATVNDGTAKVKVKVKVKVNDERRAKRGSTAGGWARDMRDLR